ncbi:UNVERIFIED_CONTAM: Potassium/sodium hyperpolarization-activated cyclic nucleotide-gated channel 4 [Siphonaria sp. JEL0065]|nr:Potassium/sodium hyperpolarization-activated cyclic nucleotide-gated channel 4 [Siphonaria sp. JEL0065]
MSINPSGRLYTQKMEELNDYVKWKNLNLDTQKKLFSYYETKYRGKYFEEEALLLEMNESLRAEISLQNTRALIERVPFLRRNMGDGRDEIFFGRLATILHAQYFVKNDFVTKQGDYGFDMYFILSGMVNVFVNDRKVISLYDGAYFGEVALIAKILRTATVQATTPSVLYRLTYNDFHSVLAEFDDMKLKINMLALEHEQRLKNAETTEAAVAKLRKLGVEVK